MRAWGIKPLFNYFWQLLILTDTHKPTHTQIVLYVNKVLNMRTLIINVSQTYVYTFCEKAVQGETLSLLVCHVFISGENIRFLISDTGILLVLYCYPWRFQNFGVLRSHITFIRLSDFLYLKESFLLIVCLFLIYLIWALEMTGKRESLFLSWSLK